MLEKPDAADLLATARDVVLTQLLPALPEEHRFAARMVANAMAIASREQAAETAPTLAALQAALMAPGIAAKVLLPRLAAEIRAGAHDPGTPEHPAVVAALVALAKARCAVSNPRALG
jgi:hypothetical protein